MSKKIVAFMVVVCVGLAALVGWFRLNGDRTAPEVTCNNTSLVYDESMTDAQLLENVIAFDEKDGDVSDSLTVEAVYPVDEDQVCIVYVAKDHSNNVTKVKQIYASEPSEDSDADDDSAKEELPDETGETDSAPGEAADEDTDTAEDTESPDTESNDEEASNDPNEENAAETSADVSAEAEQARAEQEAAAQAMPAQSPRIYLTDYVVTVQAGTSVDRLSYVKEITDDADNVYDLWTKIQITGSLDTLTPGTYECTYYVVDSSGNTSNQAVLKFIVK